VSRRVVGTRPRGQSRVHPSVRFVFSLGPDALTRARVRGALGVVFAAFQSGASITVRCGDDRREVAMSGRGTVINWGRIVQKRAKKGLFAGKTTHFGNRVSEDGGNKSRRSWKPNAHRKRLYSETLDEMIPLNVTTNALRWIDKAGGLDEYVLNTPVQKLLSTSGLALRERILAAKAAGATADAGLWREHENPEAKA
jgi:large subunit ribosomal protein L28